MRNDAITPDNDLAELDELESAEDFLDYFGLDYLPEIVNVNRLHILQRFHDYLGRHDPSQPPTRADYRLSLSRSYEDFVHSDAITEKVFRVLKRASGIATIPVSAIGRARH